MAKTFTHEDYLRLKNEEEALLGDLATQNVTVKEINPSQNTIDNILNFSKALSIKSSKYTDHIESILN